MKTLALMLLIAAVSGFAYWLGWENRNTQISATVCEESLDR